MKTLTFLLIAALAAPAVFAEPPAAEPPAAEPPAVERASGPPAITAGQVYAKAASYAAMDARFASYLVERAAASQRWPNFEARYQAALAAGEFDGAAPDYAMWLALAELSVPIYGYGAMIYCPPNDPAYIAMLRHWRGETIDCSTYTSGYESHRYLWSAPPADVPADPPSAADPSQD